MTQTYYPFDAGNGANITEAQWQEMAELWLSTGVIKGQLNALEVYANDSGMQTYAKTGKAWIKGHFYKNDAEVVLAHSAADATNPRIDRVIVRLDWTANTIALAVLSGTPAASPTAPALTQSTSRWEISLAQVLIDALAATIAANKVTDERSWAMDSGAIEDWKAPSLLNSWVNYGGVTYGEAKYRKDAFGRVFLGGLVKDGTTGSGNPIFTLPTDYRPAYRRSFPVVSNGLFGRLEVLQNGNVELMAGSNLYVALDGVSFFID